MPGKIANEIFEKTDNNIILDEVDANTTFIAEAEPGTASSDSRWKAKRMKKTGTVTKITWADGNNKFDNIGDDIRNLTYS